MVMFAFAVRFKIEDDVWCTCTVCILPGKFNFEFGGKHILRREKKCGKNDRIKYQSASLYSSQKYARNSPQINAQTLSAILNAQKVSNPSPTFCIIYMRDVDIYVKEFECHLGHGNWYCIFGVSDVSDSPSGLPLDAVSSDRSPADMPLDRSSEGAKLLARPAHRGSGCSLPALDSTSGGNQC